MSSAAFDYNDMRILSPHLDPDRPRTPLEALEDGDLWASEGFADWMADEDQRAELHDLLCYLEGDDVVKALARKWSREEMQ